MMCFLQSGTGWGRERRVTRLPHRSFYSSVLKANSVSYLMRLTKIQTASLSIQEGAYTGGTRGEQKQTNEKIPACSFKGKL